MATVLRSLGNGTLTDSEIQKIMIKGAEPAAIAMQSEYNKIDTADGTVNLRFDVKGSQKNKHVVFVGPNRLSKGFQLAHIMEYGTVQRYMKKGLRAGNITQRTLKPFSGPPYFAPYKGKSTGIMPAGGFMRRGLAISLQEVARKMQEVFDKYLTAKAKKINK